MTPLGEPLRSMRGSALAAAVVALAQAGAGGREVPAIPASLVRDAESSAVTRIERARAAVEAGPASAPAWLELGRVFHAHQFPLEAETCYGRAVELAPEDFASAYLGALAGELAGRPAADVLARYARAKALRPSYLPLHLRVGNLLAREGRGEEALAAYRVALVFDLHYAPARLGLGQVLLSQGRAAEALEHLEDAAASAPDDRAVLAALSRASMAAGRPERARELAERCRLAAPTLDDRDQLLREVERLAAYASAAQQRGQRAFEAQLFEEAIEAFELVLEQRPDSPQVLAQIGTAYLQVGRVADAERALARAVELGPGNAAARLTLALIYARESPRRLELALAEVDAVLALDAKNVEAAVQKGTILAQLGRLEEAVETFGLVPGALDAKALVTLGGALYRLGRVEEARTRYEEAIAANPRYGLAHFNLGALHEAGGERQAALAAYRRAAALDPRLPAAERIAALEREKP